jgi:hypoxanthine phosphoribosyltransferase
MRHTTIRSMNFTLFTWEDMDLLTRELAQQVKKSGKEFDRIIAVANGGLTMARHFGDQIGLRKISLIQTAFYAGVGETGKEPTLLQQLVVDVTGERLLVFEDIVDTGATLEFLCPMLMDQYEAKSVSVAALVTKSWSSVQPEFAAKCQDSWIIYPYETQETIVALTSKWTSEGLAIDKITTWLEEIGFSAADISAFLPTDLPLSSSN